VDGDGAGVLEEGLAPDRFHQLVAGVDPAGVRGQVGEQVELAHRQRERLAVEEGAAGRRLDAQRAVLDRRRFLIGWRDTAQHRVYPGDQLSRREGLDDVIVGALAQADEAVGLLAAGGQHDHRDPRSRLLVQLPHHLDPVDSRQHQVEHDQVGTVQGGEAQCLGPVGGAVGLIAGPLHVAADDVEDRRLVVDDQHGALGGVGHRRDCRAWPSGLAANRR